MRQHEDRRRAESFGADADRYDRARPTYPSALITAVVGDAPARLRVLDVGCGTGIAARLFAARGAEVLGVEVDPRMVAVARRQGTAVEVGRFEEWDPAGRRFDRVTAAQAWHWVDPVAGAAKAASVLRPGGRLCVFWNGADSGPLSDAFDEVYRRLAPDLDGYSVLLGGTRRSHGVAHRSHGEADSAEMEGIRRSGAFTEPSVQRFRWTRTYTRDEWLDQLPTHSDHARLDPADLQALLGELAGVIDGAGGSFPLTYSTVLVSATVR